MISALKIAIVSFISIALAGCVTTAEEDYGIPEDFWEKIDEKAQGGS